MAARMFPESKLECFRNHSSNVPGIRTMLVLVNMTVPFKGEEHRIALGRLEAEEYLGVDFWRIHDDRENELWRKEIVARFFNPQERIRFVNRFVVVRGRP
jgi:predicted transcriptional regulator with HTH domain